MKKVSENQMPKIAYVFGDLTGGGHNLQAFKTILYSGAKDNCMAISLFDDADSSLEAKLKDEDIKVVKLNLSGKTALTKGVKLLRNEVEKNGCVIVHSNGLKADTLCHLAFKKSQIKHVITLHNYLKEDVYLRKGKLYSAIALYTQNKVLNQSNYIIACSKTLQQQMLGDNPKLKITAIQNGVDINKFQRGDTQLLRAQYGIDPNILIFISTGRMSPRKRITETADAFLQTKLDEKCQLWFVGNGECFDEYKNKYVDRKNIRFWGRRNDISNLLNMADAFISSSETEGLPLAVLEAISTGKYVLLSDIPQHKEIIDEFPSGGALYSLGNKSQLANLIINYQECGESSDLVELKGSNFDIETMGKYYQDYYINIMKKDEGTFV